MRRTYIQFWPTLVMCACAQFHQHTRAFLSAPQYYYHCSLCLVCLHYVLVYTEWPVCTVWHFYTVWPVHDMWLSLLFARPVCIMCLFILYGLSTLRGLYCGLSILCGSPYLSTLCGFLYCEACPYYLVLHNCPHYVAFFTVRPVHIMWLSLLWPVHTCEIPPALCCTSHFFNASRHTTQHGSGHCVVN